MSRRRNILVRTERTQALDDIFATKAESFEYKDDAYVLHFTKPTTVNQVQIWSNCPNVEPLVRGKKRPIPDSVYKSVLKAQSEYRSLVERGKSIDIILRKCGISEDVLQLDQRKALKAFRSVEKKHQEAKQRKIEEQKKIETVENIKPIPVIENGKVKNDDGYYEEEDSVEFSEMCDECI